MREGQHRGEAKVFCKCRRKVEERFVVINNIEAQMSSSVENSWNIHWTNLKWSIMIFVPALNLRIND